MHYRPVTSLFNRRTRENQGNWKRDKFDNRTIIDMEFVGAFNKFSVCANVIQVLREFYFEILF
jgi:hypothetical protein